MMLRRLLSSNLSGSVLLPPLIPGKYDSTLPVELHPFLLKTKPLNVTCSNTA